MATQQHQQRGWSLVDIDRVDDRRTYGALTRTRYFLIYEDKERAQKRVRVSKHAYKGAEEILYGLEQHTTSVY